MTPLQNHNTIYFLGEEEIIHIWQDWLFLPSFGYKKQPTTHQIKHPFVEYFYFHISSAHRKWPQSFLTVKGL